MPRVARVLLVRHAESTDNVVEHDDASRMTAAQFAAFVAGADRARLTPAGRAAAAAVAERLRAWPVARVYTSPLSRAAETASIVAAALALPAPTALDGLRELVPVLPRRAAFPARALRLDARLWPAYARMLLLPRSPDRLPVSIRRLRAAWRVVVDGAAGETVVAVGHGWSTGVLLATLRLDRAWRVRRVDHANCGVSIVERSGPR